MEARLAHARMSSKRLRKASFSCSFGLFEQFSGRNRSFSAKNWCVGARCRSSRASWKLGRVLRDRRPYLCLPSRSDGAARRPRIYKVKRMKTAVKTWFSDVFHGFYDAIWYSFKFFYEAFFRHKTSTRPRHGTRDLFRLRWLFLRHLS